MKELPRLARLGLIVVGAVVLLTVSAKLQVPFWPVPMTLQSLVVLLIGGFMSPLLAGISVGAYLALGLAGVPVFAGAEAGPAYMAGPTGGFLLSFLGAAVMVAVLLRLWTGSKAVIVAMVLGHGLMMLWGASWIAFHAGWPVAVEAALQPFVVGAVVKTAAAAGVVIWLRAVSALTDSEQTF